MPDPGATGATGTKPKTPLTTGDPAEDLTRAKNSTSGYRGTVTNRINAIRSAIQDANNAPTERSLLKLDEALVRAETAYDKYEASVPHLLSLASAADQNTITTKASQTADEMATIRSEVSAATSAIEDKIKADKAAALNTNTNPPPNPITGPRIINDLIKPDTLTLDFNPAEFSSWCKAATSFFRTNNLDSDPAQDQQSYLLHFLSPDLRQKVEEKVEPSDLLKDIIGKLESEFLIKYPLFKRRFEVFRTKRKESQNPTAWVAQIATMAAEAQCHKLTWDETFIFIILAGINNDSLRNKIQDMTNPTLAEVRNKIETWEANKASNDTIDNESSSSVKQTKSGNPLCFRCGSPNHRIRTCNHPETVICSKCKQQGHFSRMCGSQPQGQSQSQRGQPQGRGGFTRGRGQPRGQPRGRGNFRGSNNRGGGQPGQARQVQDQQQQSPASNQPQQGQGRQPTVHYYEHWADDEDEGEDSTLNSVRLATISSNANKSIPTPSLTAKVRPADANVPWVAIEAIPDTGATRSVLNAAFCEKLGGQIMRTKETLRTASGQKLKCLGSTLLEIQTPTIPVYVNCVVTRELEDDLLLSWHDLQILGVIPRNFPAILDPSSLRKLSNHQDDDDVELEKIFSKIKSDYSDVLSDELGERRMNVPPVKLELIEGATPYRCLRPRTVPLHKKPECIKTKDKLGKSSIIRRHDKYTEWCSPSSFVTKPDGSERLITDFTQLNRWLKRPVVPFPSPEEVIQRIPPKAKYFVTLDCVQGYHQLLLDEESQELTAFLLEDGKYVYETLPMGASPAGDLFNIATDPIIEDVPHAEKIMDDVLLENETLAEVDKNTRKVLEKCRELGITISLKKLQYGKKVKYAGYIISSEGVTPDPKKLAAVESFPSPKSKTELRGFLGLSNQLTIFHPDLAHSSAPLRPLLGKDVEFLWTIDHEKAFQDTKRLLSSYPLVKPFDPSLKTELLCDASRLYGVGFMLTQIDQKGHRRIVKCGSFGLTPTQKRYSVSEIECLAVKRAVDKCKFFLLGAPEFTVVTDHRPLVGLWAKDIPDIINPRLQRLRTSLMPYKIKMSWVQGKTHLVADALSRSPVFSPEEEIDEEMPKIRRLESNNKPCLTLPDDPLFLPLVEAIDSDYEAVIAAFKSDTRLAKLPKEHPARAYKAIWDDISLAKVGDRELLLYDQRIIVPLAARAPLLTRLHASHQGMSKMKAGARRDYYWPNLGYEIEQLVQGCQQCRERLPSQSPEPLQVINVNAPMEAWAVDLAHANGHDFVILVDCFSGFPFCRRMTRTTTEAVTDFLLEIFAMFGMPAYIFSDNGPQFRSLFSEFCSENGIIHWSSSP